MKLTLMQSFGGTKESIMINLMHVSRIVHFTAVCLVTGPSSGSEAGVDLVLIQTLLIFTWKSCCSRAE